MLSTQTERGTAAPPTFLPMSIVAKRSPILVTAELLYKWSPKKGALKMHDVSLYKMQNIVTGQVVHDFKYNVYI